MGRRETASCLLPLMVFTGSRTDHIPIVFSDDHHSGAWPGYGSLAAGSGRTIFSAVGPGGVFRKIIFPILARVMNPHEHGFSVRGRGHTGYFAISRAGKEAPGFTSGGIDAHHRIAANIDPVAGGTADLVGLNP